MPIRRDLPARLVCHFSCGAASAVATKLALTEHLGEVLIVNAFIAEEHPDNRRFLGDCERWFGHRVTVLRDEKFGASTDEVWRRNRYINGMYGAPCSRALKRELLEGVCLPEDVNVLGFTAEEEDRLDKLIAANNGRKLLCPLIDRGLTKADCLSIVEHAGIELPMMYRLGYDNANCRGCPKGGQAYWQAIREDFPERFIAVKAIQEAIGPGAYFLRFRSGPRKGERMPLADLPAGRGDMCREPSFSCSFFCAMAEEDIA
jgi:hypothetical protein